WALLPAVGTLAVALVALVVVLGRGGEGASTTTSSSSGGSAAVQDAPADRPAGSARRLRPAPGSAGTAESAVGTVPPPARSSSPATVQSVRPPAVVKPGGARKVQRTAELVLETPVSKFDATSDDVVRTVDRFDGIVASSSIGSDDSSGAEATFDVRIPTARLDAALAALSRLGHVAERRQDLEDITGSFTSLQSRLGDARAERRGLLRALARATTQAQVESLRTRLRDMRGTIGRLNGDLAALRRRADLSRVTVTVQGVDGTAGGGGGGAWSPGDAARDALRVLEVMAGVTVIALATAVPLALLGLAVALAVRSLRRRGRERALDPA
ncbi:MAG: hypothetical protein QOD24_4781, partial [Solirubrobacteraceae bacterium]|nr:hypothetical protein [Solirubrobacteraceae bacterium]